jgi:hypothetical protein
MTFPFPGGNDDVDLEFDVEYDFEAYVDLDIDTEVTYDSHLDVDACIDVDVDIDGNTATWNIDAQAFGDDTAVEVNVVAFAADEYSNVVTTGYVAVDGGGGWPH